MSCEYCRGEKHLYCYDGDWSDGKGWHEYHFNTKIAHGQFIGTSSSLDYASIGGACVEANYCPMCGCELTLEEE